MIRRIRPPLVIKIVQEANDSPFLLILAELSGLGPQHRLHRQHVPPQRLRGRVFVHQSKRRIAILHEGSVDQRSQRTEEPKYGEHLVPWSFDSWIFRSLNRSWTCPAASCSPPPPASRATAFALCSSPAPS